MHKIDKFGFGEEDNENVFHSTTLMVPFTTSGCYIKQLQGVKVYVYEM